ncbi:MAG TPA: rhodanese-like domain-containing protein [Flavobacteriaceae bacterium]|nr:rhodanese-like domain-containing protein [Flavobacteriaceae bacterium]
MRKMNNKRVIIDVRSPEEFIGGNVAGSINIPLPEIPSRLEEIKAMDNPLLCCASGGRSGQVAEYLKANGIECENGGGWLEVNYRIAQQS